MRKILMLLLTLLLMASCTMTVAPDGTTTYAPLVVEPVAVGAPWVGVGTPWYYYNSYWYYRGTPYVYYTGWGWWPYGSKNTTIITNSYWYNKSWNNWYNNNPSYGKAFHSKYGNPAVPRKHNIGAPIGGNARHGHSNVGNLGHVNSSAGNSSIRHSGVINKPAAGNYRAGSPQSGASQVRYRSTPSQPTRPTSTGTRPPGSSSHRRR